VKILLCSISSPHELTGIGKYNGELVEWFRDKGHHVDVLTTLPYYPYWEIYKGYENDKFKIERSERGNIYSVRLPVSKNVSTLRRIMMDVVFGLKTVVRLPRLAYRQKYDIIVLVLPPITAFLSAIFGKVAGRSKLHIHVQDLQLEAAGDLDLLPAPLLNLLERFEKYCLAKADLVTTISNKMADQLRRKITNDSPTVSLLENWADTDIIKPIPDKSWLKNKYEYPEDTFLVVYSGNIGEKQGVGQLLAVASMLENHKKIQFLILGDGAGKKKLLEKNKELNLSNVRFGELVAESHLNRMLNGSDIQLVLQKKMAGDSFLPSKYINILSAGIPSVITAQKGTALYTMATENKTSIVVEAENTTMLAEAVLRLFNKKEFRKRLAKNSRMLALQSYGKDEILNNLQQTYMRMLN